MAGSQSCHKPAGQPTETAAMAEGKPEYALGFRIERTPAYRILHVINPWQGSRRVHFQYILTDDSLAGTGFIKASPGDTDTG